MAKKPASHDRRAGVWASVSVTTFIVVFLSSTVMGYGVVLPFIFAAGAMLFVMFLETLTRGRSWMFEEGLRDVFAHTKTASRIIVFACGLLLILETALILGFATDPRFDGIMIRLIQNKQCILSEHGC